MIDLHCHILPGMDDGAANMKVGVKLAKDAVKQGIDQALLTPHTMDRKYLNHKKDVITQTNKFQKILKQEHIPLKVYPGQEVHITGNLIKAIDNNDILFADPKHHYLMLELPHTSIPEYTEEMLFELRSRSITPVIVHPERNAGFQSNPDKLYKFVSEGALTQLTASSYVGTFGKTIQKFTEQIINANLGTTFSSDAHNFHGRGYRMKEAYAKLANKKGFRYARLFEYNAYSIINGYNVPIGNIQRIKKKRFFWEK